MDELVRWLGQQLDEDERIARRLLDDKRPDRAERWEFCDDGAIRDTGGHRSVRVKFTWPPEADHIVRHDPARVLREIDAKREVIAKHTKAVERMAELASLCERLKANGKDTFMPEMDRATAIHRRDVLYEVLQLHALPYADRPGFKESWRP